MPQSLLQPAPFRTPFFAKDGQIHEEWRRFFLSSQALVNLLLQEITLGMPHPSLVSAEEGDPSDPFIVPGPTGPAGGAGPPGSPGLDGDLFLDEPLLSFPPGLPQVASWTDIPFNAGNFTGNGSITWTVTAGEQTTFAYAIVDKNTAVVSIRIENTTVAGVGSALVIALPAVITPSRSLADITLGKDNGTSVSAFYSILAGTTALNFLLISGANWQASTTATSVFAQMSYQIG